MKIAVIQQRTRRDSGRDSAELGDSVSSAIDAGADIVVAPLGGTGAHAGAPSEVLLWAPPGTRPVWRDVTALGDTVQLLGDTCFDPEVMRPLHREPPDALILHPDSESDLQAEALVEYALGLSRSVASLVIVSEFVPQIGSGVGWSAILFLGEVLAEAVAADDVLFADVEVPISAPGSREALPYPSAILSHRLAVHRGDRPDVGYMAEL